MAAATLNCFKPLISTPSSSAGWSGAFAARTACVSTLLRGEREQTEDSMCHWHRPYPSPLALIYPSG